MAKNKYSDHGRAAFEFFKCHPGSSGGKGSKNLA